MLKKALTLTAVTLAGVVSLLAACREPEKAPESNLPDGESETAVVEPETAVVEPETAGTIVYRFMNYADDPWIDDTKVEVKFELRPTDEYIYPLSSGVVYVHTIKKDGTPLKNKTSTILLDCNARTIKHASSGESLDDKEWKNLGEYISIMQTASKRLSLSGLADGYAQEQMDNFGKGRIATVYNSYKILCKSK